MTDPCENPQPRRDQLYAHNQRTKAPDQRLNGIDEIEVDGQTLTLYFMDHAPDGLMAKNIRIDGGLRVTRLRVTGIDVCDVTDPTIDDCVRIFLDRVGDASTYTLTLIEARGSKFRLDQFDPRALSIPFTFTADCPTEIDCAAETPCPPEVYDEPSLDYLAKDYASFRQLILDRLALIMPGWTERHIPDIGVALVELFAYTGDYLSYYQDAVATEAYLDTARRRISVRRHARLVDYRMHEGCNARAWLHIAVESDMTLDFTPTDNNLPLPPIMFVTDLSVTHGLSTVVRASEIESKAIPRSAYAVFEPVYPHPVRFYADFNTIQFYTWGETDCCLPTGTTQAWLVIDTHNTGETDQGERIKSARAAADALMAQGFLLFEEVIGAQTGNPADADRSRRVIVRLTSVEPIFDPVYRRVVLAITWHEADALPFALCLTSTVVFDGVCVDVTGISTARGNLILVDQGETRVDPCTPPVASKPGDPDCACDDCGESLTDIPLPLRFTLAESRVVFRETIKANAPASLILIQDPRKASAQVLLSAESLDGVSIWTPQADLIASGSQDRHFVVEIDDDGIAHIRFGDDTQGMMPPVGSRFCPLYRIDRSESGGIGADTITHLVMRDGYTGGILAVRNPLPAAGNIPPEPLVEVKRRAPTAHKSQRMRAITADDYAQIVMDAFPQIERAAAAFHWTGTWYEVQVAVDPRGSTETNPELLAQIEAYLRPFHRMGYDLRVMQALYVPLHLEIDLCVKDGYLRGHVEAALKDALSSRRGYFHPDRQTFGTPITLSALVAAVQAVPGVDSVNRLIVTAKDITYEFPEYRDGVLLPGAQIMLAALEIARMENTPGFAQNGTLKLNLRGGR